MSNLPLPSSLRVAPHSHLSPHISGDWVLSVFQDANVKLIRELREEIGRLKAMLLSFELVCGHQDFFVLRRPFSSAEDLSSAAFCALSQVMLEEQSGSRDRTGVTVITCVVSEGMLHLCCPKAICLHDPCSVCGQIRDMRPSRKNCLEFSFFVPLWAQYLAVWFASDFNNNVFPLSAPFLPKSKGGAHEAHLSLCAEKLPFIEWGKGWKPEGADSPKWIEGGYVGGALLCFTSPLEPFWPLSIIPGPGLLPHQDREVLSRENFCLHWALNSGMFVLGLLIGFLTALFSQGVMITPFRQYGSLEKNSVQFSRSVVSDSLQPHELQHARPPCPSQTPGVYPNSCPSSRWCHPAVSSSVVPFSSCPQSLQASGSFPMSQLFTWGGQSIVVSASASVLPMNTQNVPMNTSGWIGWISLQSKGLSGK